MGMTSPETSAIPLPVTIEDVKRAQDRKQVELVRAGRTPNRALRLLWLLIGPGILVMLGENDGPSMISYATTGATYGIGFFVSQDRAAAYRARESMEKEEEREPYRAVRNSQRSSVSYPIARLTGPARRNRH